MKRLMLTTAICLTAGTFSVSAQTTTPVAGTTQVAPAPADSSRYWYDGARKRIVWVLDDLVAEIPGGDEAGQVKSLDPEATLTDHGSAKVRIYRLSAGKHAGTLVEAAGKSAGTSKAKHSEVFRDGRGGRSRLRSLPGGVIVVFRNDWTDEQGRTWLGAQKLVVKGRLTFTKNAYLVEAPAGTASLDLANRLYETGEVRTASPDWWTENRAK